jgi:hypothetical protein
LVKKLLFGLYRLAYCPPGLGLFAMRRVWQRGTILLALYAVALHVILLGFLPVSPGAFAPINPFAIICHATGPAAKPGERPPGKLNFIPGRAIDHCNLCSAAAAPPAPKIAFNIDFQSTRVLHVFSPHSAPVRSGLIFDPKLIRGPPPPYA